MPMRKLLSLGIRQGPSLQLVTSEEEADIILTEMDDSTVSAAGESQTKCFNQCFKR